MAVVLCLVLLIAAGATTAREYTFYDVCDVAARFCVVWPGNIFGSQRRMSQPQTFLGRDMQGTLMQDGWTLKINQCDEQCDPDARYAGGSGVNCLTGNGTAACATSSRYRWELPYIETTFRDIRIEPLYAVTAGDESTYALFVTSETTLAYVAVPRLCTSFVFRAVGPRVSGIQFDMTDCAANATAYINANHAGNDLHASLTPLLLVGADMSGTDLRYLHASGGALAVARVVPAVGGATVNLANSQIGPGLSVDTATAFATGVTLAVHATLTNFYGSNITINSSTVLAQPTARASVTLHGATYVNLTELTGSTASVAACPAAPACDCPDTNASGTTRLMLYLVSAVAGVGFIAFVLTETLRHVRKKAASVSGILDAPPPQQPESTAAETLARPGSDMPRAPTVRLRAPRPA